MGSTVDQPVGWSVGGWVFKARLSFVYQDKTAAEQALATTNVPFFTQLDKQL